MNEAYCHKWFVTRNEIYLFVIWRVGEVLEKKFFILFNSFNFFYVFTPAPYTLKGSRNIQGFALIRAVLFVVLVSFSCCSDFRNESNGMFALGWFFFQSFLTEFFVSLKKYSYFELKFETIFCLRSFFVNLWGSKIAILANLWLLTRTINA